MGVDDLRHKQRQVIEAIVRGPVAWSSRATISRRTRRRSGPILAALESLRWVTRWDRARDGRGLRADYWTLTPLGASWAGVMMDEAEEGIPRWCPGPIETPLRSHARLIRYPERVEDPHPLPEYVLDLDEGTTTTDERAAMKVHGIPITVDPARRHRAGSARAPGIP